MIKTNIMLIDNDEMMAAAMARILQRHGYIVEICDEIQYAQNLVESYAPRVIIIESDVLQEDVVLFLDLIKKSKSDIKLFIISGKDNEVELLAAGADEWLKKPCKIPVLLTRLEMLCR